MLICEYKFHILYLIYSYYISEKNRVTQICTTDHREHFQASLIQSQCLGSAYEISYALPSV